MIGVEDLKRSFIPDATLSRLPRYYRVFCELNDKGVNKISSAGLAKLLSVTASQVRQDFSCFGTLGQQGYGYNVQQICHDLGEVIGVDKLYRAILIGTGNLGKSVLSGTHFYKNGFRLIGIFDRKESIVGQVIKGIPVRHIDGLDEFCRENFPQMAILCVPPDQAELLFPQLVSLGITAFWNFSGYELPKLSKIAVSEVVLDDTLTLLCSKMRRTE